MLALATAWSFVKKYWSYFALVALIVAAYVLFRENKVDFTEEMKKIQDAHDEELRKIQEARDAERKQHEANVKQLQDALNVVQKQYDEAMRDLDSKKKKEIESLVKQYGNDPGTLAKKLSEATGFVIVMPE